MQTCIRGLFAAGDLRAQLTRQVTTAVGDATTAAIAAEKYLKALSEGGSTVIEPIVGTRRVHGVKIHLAHRRAVPGEHLSRDRRDAPARGARSIPATTGDDDRRDGARIGRDARRDLADARAHRSHRRRSRACGGASPCRCYCIRWTGRSTTRVGAHGRDVRASVRAAGSARPASSRTVTCCAAATLRFTVMHVPGHSPGLVSFNGRRRRFVGRPAVRRLDRPHRPAAQSIPAR